MNKTVRDFSREKVFTSAGLSDIIITTDGQWLVCPVCKRHSKRHKLLRILPSTVVKDLPVYCKHCRNESVVNISF